MLDYDFWGEGADVRGIGIIYLLLRNSDVCFSLTFLIRFHTNCLVLLHSISVFLLHMPVCDI